MKYRAKSTVCSYAAHAWLLGSLSLATSFAGEIGSVCVRDYSAGLECNGNDVRITALEPVTILEDCASGDPGTAEAVFEVWVSAAGSPSSYDIGLFLALNGDSALSGGYCFHDYLEPPLTPSPTYGDVDGNGTPDIYNGPWWDGDLDTADSCGDIGAGTDLIKTLVSFRFACTDSTLDGVVDFSACASWSSGTQARCSALTDAYPATSARCGCGVVETAVSMPVAEVPSGRVAGLSIGFDTSGDLLLAWTASCSASDTDYIVYEGTLGDFASHHRLVCSTGGMTSATIQPPPDDSYYLVVPRNSLREGSYGLDSAGAERPPATNACLPQLVQDFCP